MGASSPGTFKEFPNRVMEDQDVEMAKVTFGPPPFSSSDPETDARRLLPLHDQTAEDAEAAAASADFNIEEATAAEMVEHVKGLNTQDQLDEFNDQYDETGKDYKTVGEALQAKQDELDAQDDTD
jgi:hypothetical protein